MPHAISVTTADVTDRNGAIELLKIKKKNLTDVKNVMADFGYSGKNFANEVYQIIGSKVEIVKNLSKISNRYKLSYSLLVLLKKIDISSGVTDLFL